MPLHGAGRHGHGHAQHGAAAVEGPTAGREPAELVRELYAEENRGKREPSGSQDMIGLIYPGVNRLDFDFDHEGGIFPRHIESNNDPAIARWLESGDLHAAGAAPADGYNPLGIKNLDPQLDPPAGPDRQGVLRRHRGCDAPALGAR